VRLVVRGFSTRTPGSYSEETESSIAWHYERTGDFGLERAEELRSHIDRINLPVTVTNNARCVEIRPHEANPTVIMKKVMALHPDFGFLLYLGDQINMDFSQESTVVTCGVDNKHHKTYLKAEEVGTFLEQLADATPPLPPPAPAVMSLAITAAQAEAHAAATNTVAAVTQSQTQGGANNVVPAVVPKVVQGANVDDEAAEVAE